MTAANHLIFKIVDRDAWSTAKASGEFRGSPVDLTDGFMHFSAPGQLAETASRHFAGQKNFDAGCRRCRVVRRCSEMGTLTRRRSVSASLRTVINGNTSSGRKNFCATRKASTSFRSRELRPFFQRQAEVDRSGCRQDFRLIEAICFSPELLTSSATVIASYFPIRSRTSGSGNSRIDTSPQIEDLL